MEVRDIGFVQAAAIVRQIELTAQLEDYPSSRVHSYKLSMAGHKQKLAMVVLLESNRAKIKLWGTKKGRTEEMLCLARSIYQTNGIAMETCLRHRDIIGAHLMENGQNV